MKNKKKHTLLISLIILIMALIAFLISFYFYSLTAVSKNNTKVNFIVESGSGKKTIIKKLKDEKLIKNDFIALIYLYLNNDKILISGTYELSPSMSTPKIIDIISRGESLETKETNVTFIDGKRLTNYVNVMNQKLGFSEEEIYERVSNKEFLSQLIDRYWFLTDQILNDKIYYALEGYLYPDTYSISKTATIDDVIIKMLDNMEKKLQPYKEVINSSNYTFHEILTLASIVDLEGNTEKDRKLIAGVFLNRLNSNMNLGSDITTYYGVKKNIGDVLTASEFNNLNAYNTRAINFKGLPVSPVCNPTIESILAVIKPTMSDYYYFYAEDTKTIHYAKTYEEHLNIINSLK